jgi:hypothetical protein
MHSSPCWRLTRLGLLLLLGLAGPGCPGETPPTPPECPEGHEARERACVPVLDVCPGPAEVPILGGGCAPIGVTACATGFTSDGTGGCDPILPAAPCPDGALAYPGLRAAPRSTGAWPTRRASGR